MYTEIKTGNRDENMVTLKQNLSIWVVRYIKKKYIFNVFQNSAPALCIEFFSWHQQFNNTFKHVGNGFFLAM